MCLPLLFNASSAVGQGVEPGAIVVWGIDDHGEVSDAPEGHDFIDVDCDLHWCAAVRIDGSIEAWGFDQTCRIACVPSAEESDFVMVALTQGGGAALGRDGTLTAWGANSNACEGNDFIALEGGEDGYVALRADGSLCAWGRPGNPPEGNDFVAIAAEGQTGLALKEDGSLVQWGDNDAPGGNDYVGIGRGRDFGMAIRTDGSIAWWGADQCDLSSPPEGDDFATVNGGYHHAVALRLDGTIEAWGCNPEGETDACGTGSMVVAGSHNTAAILPEPHYCDFDGDGLPDDCDDDIDNDGVMNAEDVCDYTPAGAPIITDPESPLYGTLRADLDGDCDCDLEDYTLFHRDFTGPSGVCP